MKQLVQCLIEWIDQLHASAQAAVAIRALASETLKRIDSADPQQRQFDALYLAEAADPTKQWDYDLAKQWLSRASVHKFVDSRMHDLCGFFQNKGHQQIVVPQKSETTGRHRAYWVLVAQPVPSAPQEAADVPSPPSQADAEATSSAEVSGTETLVYEYTPSTALRLGPLGRILLGQQGNTPTKSARGVIWAAIVLLAGLSLVLILFVLWAMTRLQRPLTAGDLASVVMLLITVVFVWRVLARPLIWLTEDRIIPAPDMLTAMREEEPCQLEMPKEGNARYIRLVRYSGVCPVCAGRIDLRYGAGHVQRRLFGCCSEAPQDHQFSFDRVSRQGQRVKR